jgi:hypothetical protein
LVALAIVPATCFLPQSYLQLLCILPLFGFFTLGMHAGYAIYFPELFPTRLRATGASFCFNVGRLVSAVTLIANRMRPRRISVSYWTTHAPSA